MDQIQYKETLIPQACGDIFIRYVDMGYKHTFLCVHGFLGHSHWWDWVVPYLLPSANILLIDLPGMGNSHDRDQYTLYDMGSAINAVANHSPVQGQLHLVGHSFGALASAHALIQAPEKFASFSCIDMDLTHLSLVAQPKATPPSRCHYDSADALLARYRLIPPETNCPHAWINRLAKHSITQFDDGWAWSFDPGVFYTHKNNVLAAYQALFLKHKLKTQLILGEDSSVIDIQKSSRHWRTMVGHQMYPICVLPGHHHLMLDSPHALAQQLLRFIMPL